MPNHDDDFLDSSSIVPNREDRVTQPSLAKMNPPKMNPAKMEKKVATNTTATSSINQWLFTVLVLVITLCVAGYQHYRLAQQQDLNTRLQNRITTLEAQLGISATNDGQKSQTIEEKVKALDLRINATNNDLTKQQASNEKALNALQVSTAELKKLSAQNDKQNDEAKKIATDGKTIAERANNSIADINTGLSALQQRLAQGDPVARDASRQATMALEQNDQLQKKLDTLSKRVSDQEETLRSIDSFRRSVNSDLNKLKQDRAQELAIPMQ